MLGNVRAVTADAVVDDATIVVRDGTIVDVTADSCRRPIDIDGRGLMCLPGLVDTHSAGLERELRPHPDVEICADLAVRSFEGRVRAAGVTTVFHGIAYETSPEDDRTVQRAETLHDAVTDRSADPGALVDHQILHRLDVADPEALGALAQRLRCAHEVLSARTPLVSVGDHTVGITDEHGREAHSGRRVAAGIAENGVGREHHVVAALDWLGERAQAGLIRLMAHDSVSADDVDEAVSHSALIAEFPTTLDAATRARERGLRTICGAPNALHERSRTGDVSVRTLITRGVCDGLASDEFPFSLLAAVAALVHDGVCTLPAAVRLVSAGPAETVGLHDRGRIAPGMRSDLVLVDLASRLPIVHAVMRPEDVVAQRATR